MSRGGLGRSACRGNMRGTSQRGAGGSHDTVEAPDFQSGGAGVEPALSVGLTMRLAPLCHP